MHPAALLLVVALFGLSCRAALEGRFEPPPAESLRLRVTGPLGGEESKTFTGATSRDGSFRFPGLASGAYRVEVLRDWTYPESALPGIGGDLEESLFVLRHESVRRVEHRVAVPVEVEVDLGEPREYNDEDGFLYLEIKCVATGRALNVDPSYLHHLIAGRLSLAEGSYEVSLNRGVSMTCASCTRPVARRTFHVSGRRDLIDLSEPLETPVPLRLLGRSNPSGDLDGWIRFIDPQGVEHDAVLFRLSSRRPVIVLEAGILGEGPWRAILEGPFVHRQEFEVVPGRRTQEVVVQPTEERQPVRPPVDWHGPSWWMTAKERRVSGR